MSAAKHVRIIAERLFIRYHTSREVVVVRPSPLPFPGIPGEGVNSEWIRMAQAALDFPDPLESSSTSGGGADELLDQLIGSEIDRHLARMSSARTAPPQQPSFEPAVDVAVVTEEESRALTKNLEVEIDQYFSELPAETVQTAEINAPSMLTRVPVYLRPLVWLNAPFQAVSDRARMVLGIAAIILLATSLTALGYLLLLGV